MKKLFTIIVALTALFFLKTSAQNTLLIDEVPGGTITANNEVLYFKFSIIDTSEITNIDLALCLSADTIKAWSDYIGQLRTREDLHYFDMRDQDNLLVGSAGNYHFDDSVVWEADVEYHAWLVVDLTRHTYSAYLEAGDVEYTIGEGAACRNQATEINYWSIISNEPIGGYYDVDTVAIVTSVGVKAVPPTGIDKLYSSGYNLSVYPMPARENMTVSFNTDNSSVINLSVFDLSGKELLNLENGTMIEGKFENNYDISSLNSGLYFVKLTVNGLTKDVKKVVIK